MERKLTLSTEALPAALAASAPLSFLICSSVPVRARFQARLTHKRPQVRCIADHRERPRSAGLPRAAHLAFSPSGYLVGLPANAHRGICQSTLHESVPRLLDAHLYFCPKFAFRVENLEVRQGGGQRLGRSSSLHPRVLKKFRCVQPPRSARDPTTARPGNGREPAVGLADAVRFSNLFTSAVASELTCFHCLSGKSTCVCTPRVSESRAEKSPQAHLGVLHSAQNLRRILAPKRSIAAQQNVHDDPQAPDVARFVVTFPKAGDHLRCCAQQSHVVTTAGTRGVDRSVLRPEQAAHTDVFRGAARLMHQRIL